MNRPICKECEKEGLKYTVQQPIGGVTTLMAWTQGYWNEDGNYIAHTDPNRTTYSYNCSNGHNWSETN